MRKEDAARLKSLQTLMQKTNKEHKATVLAFADQVPNVYHYKYPTGVMDLDIDLGGGWPAGGMSVLAGPDGSGKSTLMYESMAMNQRIYGSASVNGLAYLEGRPDYWYMRDRGMKIAIPDEIIGQKEDERKFRGLKPFTKEELKSFKEKVGELVIIQGSTTEEVFNNVLDCYESKAFCMIGIDSINSSVSEAENKLKDGLEDRPQQSADALTLTRFCNRVHQLSRGMESFANKTALLMVAQVRANRDRANAPSAMQKYIRQYNVTLPWSVRHAMLICLLVTPGEKLREKKHKDDERAQQIGKVINWETLKGKAGTHDGLKGEVDFTFAGGLDLQGSVIRVGYRYGIIRDAKEKIQVLRESGEPLLPDLVDDADVLCEMMRQDVELELRIRHEILGAAGKSCGYR